MTHHLYAVFFCLAVILLINLLGWLGKPGVFANMMKIICGVGLMIIAHSVWHHDQLP